MNRQEVIEALKDYNQKCKILKQIHSNKSFKYRKRHAKMTLITIIASVLLTSFGFFDKGRIINFTNEELRVQVPIVGLSPKESNRIINERQQKIDSLTLITDLFVLIVLALTIVGLIYRWQERAVEHNNAVTVLAALANDIDDLVNFSYYTDEQLLQHYQIVRGKYQMITDFLPPNSDDEFFEARKDYQFKHNQRP